MTTPKLTPARRVGLAVVAEGNRRGRAVRVSNRTSTPTATAPTVYWQVADWMIQQGLAVETEPFQMLELTPAGRVLAGKLGLADEVAS